MITTHPLTKDSAIAFVGPRPSEAHTWCDECMRWEKGILGNRLYPRGQARVLYAIASFFNRIAAWFSARGDIAFARDNKRRGLLIADEQR